MGLWLRPEVVLTQRDADCIRFSHWEVVPPAGFAGPWQDLHLQLLGRASADSVAPQSESVVVALLKSARRLCRRGQPFWHAGAVAQSLTRCACTGTPSTAHPLWQRLRSGQATRNELLAWWYTTTTSHVRLGWWPPVCASSAHTQAVRQALCKTCLRNIGMWMLTTLSNIQLQLSDEVVKRLRTAASVACSLSCTHYNWRCVDPGRTLPIAYFQESTAFFDDDCANFYQDIERLTTCPDF